MSALLRVLPALPIAVILGLSVVFWVTGLMPASARDWKWWNLLVLLPLPLLVAFVAMYFLANWTERIRAKLVLGEKPMPDAVLVSLSVRQHGFETGTDNGWAWLDQGWVRFRGYRCNCAVPLAALVDGRDMGAHEGLPLEGQYGADSDELLQLLSEMRGLEFVRRDSGSFAVILKPSSYGKSDTFSRKCKDTAFQLLGTDEPADSHWPPASVQQECRPGKELLTSWLLIIGCSLGILAGVLPFRSSIALTAQVLVFEAIVMVTLGFGLYFGISQLKRVKKVQREFRKLFSP